MKALIEGGSDVNARGADGDPPIVIAAQDHTGECLKALLVTGAVNVEAPYCVGATALSFAAGNGNVKGVELLLRCGADINATDNWGGTPLTWAISNNRPTVVCILLGRGAHAGAASVSIAKWKEEKMTEADKRSKGCAAILARWGGE